MTDLSYEALEVLRPQKGDTIAITVATRMRPDAWLAATERIKEWYPDVHVLVMPPGSRAEVRKVGEA